MFAPITSHMSASARAKKVCGREATVAAVAAAVGSYFSLQILSEGCMGAAFMQVD
jgi:hypothetical protein